MSSPDTIGLTYPRVCKSCVACQAYLRERGSINQLDRAQSWSAELCDAGAWQRRILSFLFVGPAKTAHWKLPRTRSREARPSSSGRAALLSSIQRKIRSRVSVTRRPTSRYVFAARLCTPLVPLTLGPASSPSRFPTVNRCVGRSSESTKLRKRSENRSWRKRQ